LEMKTRRIVTILVALLLPGCLQSTLNLPPDEDKIEKISAGTLENSVRIIAGPPDRIVKSKHGYRTFYYRETMTSDCAQDLATCIPIIIEHGKVAAVGHQWAKAWERQRHQKRTPDSGNGGRAVVTDREPTQEPNRAKIARLEKQVRAIPMSRTVDNLNIYRYLLKLDPDNPKYQRKVAFYKKRFEREKASRVATKKQMAAVRRWQNARLQSLQGDPPAQMAIKILSNGKYHVWLKNTGEKPFRVEPRQFFLSCEKGKRYPIYRSKDFGKEVQPGKVIEGRVTFAIPCNPNEFIYVNPGVVSVSRLIPIPKAKADEASTKKVPAVGTKK